MGSKETLPSQHPPLDFVPDVHVVHKLGGDVTIRPEVLEGIFDYHEKERKGIFVAVVSAFRGVTNSLRKVSKELKTNDVQYFEQIDAAFDPVREEIEQTIIKYFPQNSEYKNQALELANSAIIACCYQIKPFIQTFRTGGNKDWRNYVKDQIISVGESIARETVNLFINSKGVESLSISDVQHNPIHTLGRPATDERLQETAIAGIIYATKLRLVETTESIIYGGHIPGTPNGMLNDIGSSYSDSTAALVGAAHSTMIAESRQGPATPDEIRIILQKKVPKMMTSDPSVVVQAEPLSHISPESASQIAASSEKPPIHPGPVIAVHRHNKSSNGPEISIVFADMNDQTKKGTIITDSIPLDKIRAIDNITANKNLISICVNDPAMGTETGYVHALTKALSDQGISIQDIFTEGTRFWVTLSKTDVNIDEFNDTINDLRTNGFDTNRNQNCIPHEIIVREDLATISVIGNLSQYKHFDLVLAAVPSIFNLKYKASTSTPEQKRSTLLVETDKTTEIHAFLHSILVEKNPESIDQLSRYLAPMVIEELKQ